MLYRKNINFQKFYINYKIYGAYFRKLSPLEIRKYNKRLFEYFGLVHDPKIKVLKKIYEDFIKNYYLNKIHEY